MKRLFDEKKNNTNTNTNRTTLNVHHQVNMTITYANIPRFCENMTNISIADLHTNFVSSDVETGKVFFFKNLHLCAAIIEEKKLLFYFFEGRWVIQLAQV